MKVKEAVTAEEGEQCIEYKISEKWTELWNNKNVAKLQLNDLVFSSDSLYKILSKSSASSKPSKGWLLDTFHNRNVT